MWLPTIARSSWNLQSEQVAHASNIALAFNYIDTDKDGSLTREEFDNAMNRSKPK